MAQCKLTPQEFIKNSFTPQVAVVCSPGADQLCQKNNLSFVELVQPFCKLSADVNLQDTNGGIAIIHNLKISLMDVNFRPPQPTLARKFLNASVSQASEPRSQSIQVGENTLDVPQSTPWFEAWRDMFLQVQFPSDHEFTKHYLACIVVVSTSDPNPIDAANHLTQTINQLQSVVPNKLPKWFNSYVCMYYVLVHDNMDDEAEKALRSMESLNISFGIGNCFLLKINSRPQGQADEQLPDPWSQYIATSFETPESDRPTPESSPSTSRLFARSLEVGQELNDSGNTLPYHPLSPDTEAQKLNEALLEKEMQIDSPMRSSLHGMCLTTEDVEQIKLLIHEFCTRALIPFVEKLIQALTEIVSNKKGVSKSLFSATKRWFTPSKAGSNNGGSTLPLYSSDAPELQLRKLGDLYFMFCHYSMAFHVYHAAKRDFNSDQAWFYYAGALEMASLAAFMANECSRKTCDYIEEGIVTYLNVCKMAQFATRATLLSSECLKSRNLHGEAAHQLIRMTSEESDLRSALLLEQAAYCFLNCPRPMVRKYAFHMVLAGHRFSKAAQKKHALRCYKQALEVYQNKGWSFAEDHVHYTIGKLSAGLNVLQEAASSFSMLLTIQSKQSVEQQTLFLKEYLSIQRTLLESGNFQETPVLLLPLLQSEATKILVGPTPPLSIPGKVRALGVTFNTCDDTETKQKWTKLEEMVVQEAQGSLPLIFKPLVTLYTKDNINNTNLIAIINEPIQVNLKLHNPLSVALNLKDLYLLWTFKDENGSIITNEGSDINADNFLKTNVIKSLVVQSSNSQEVILHVTPLIVGELHLKGIFYNILNLEGPEDVIAVAGKQLFDLKKLGVIKKDVQDKDNQQDAGVPVSIMPPAPCLQVNFEDVNIEMLCNEIQPISMEMRNVGSVPLHKVFLATSTPHLLSSCEFRDKTLKFKEVVDLDVPAVRERIARKNHVTQVLLPNGCLESGHSYSVNIWIKAPNIKGPVWIDLLIYYENSSSTSAPRYRLIRHIWILKVYESLKINLAVTESCKSEGVKELLFGIKAINLNKLYLSTLTEITILKAALLSSCWKLKHLENIKQDQSLTIHSEQSAYILLKGQRRITKYNKYYEVSLADEDSDSKNLAYLDFAKGIEQSRINIFDDPVISKSPAGREGTLFFQWKARIMDNSKKIKTASGQTCVAIEKIKPEEEINQDTNEPIVLYDPYQSLEMQTPKSENGIAEELRTQVSMGIVHSSHVYHDFEKDKICIIPVKISVHNDSHVSSLITVNTAGTNSASPPPSFRPNLFYPYPSKDYRWVGFSGTMKTLAPLTSEVILLYVAVSSPGVYDLGGRLELWCQNDLYEKPVLQVIQALGFLTVRNINDSNVEL